MDGRGAGLFLAEEAHHARALIQQHVSMSVGNASEQEHLHQAVVRGERTVTARRVDRAGLRLGHSLRPNVVIVLKEFKVLGERL